MAAQTKAATIAQIPKTTMPIPNDAFATPQQYELDGNPTYWQGYQQAQAYIVNGIILLPSPKGSGDWQTYCTYYAPYYLTGEGVPNNSYIGSNQAINDARNYIWQKDPTSPHNVVS